MSDGSNGYVQHVTESTCRAKSRKPPATKSRFILSQANLLFSIQQNTWNNEYLHEESKTEQ